MFKHFKLAFSTFIVAFLTEGIQALKILMAGDQDKDHRRFFYSIAEAISTN